jgi:phosphoglycolate phosphatase-like HAD superfamily hydrolase
MTDDIVHVVWDWNGTLLDDLPVVVGAVNVLLEQRDLRPITADDYTRQYTRPVRTFYERLFGRDVDDAEWAEVDDVFHAAYADTVAVDAKLMAGARDVLRGIDESHRTQSLLSMYRHTDLLPLLDHFGLDDHFEVVQGLVGEGGGRKLPHLERHLAEMVHLHGDDPSRVLVIGDAIDDALAAQHLGARAVLLASGSHPRAELEATGAPVVDTLAAALDVGGVR